MAKIVIIGNSAAGFSACQELVKNSSKDQISVISKEEYPAYRKDLLVDYLSQALKEEDLFFCEGSFYKTNNINFFKNSGVARIDTKKQTVVLKDRNKIPYDYLIIASGQKVNIPDIPGKNKEGVFSFYNLDDAKKIKDKLLITNTICLAGEAEFCQRLSEVFISKNKEVKIFDILEVSELIGESTELQAVKLASGKVIAASLMIFAGNFTASSDFLKESEIKNIDGYILINENMQSNFENIFACGSIAGGRESLLEGKICAQNLIKMITKGEEEYVGIVN